MKFVAFLFVVLVSQSLLSSEIDDLFGSGDREFEFERFSNEEVLLVIDQDAEIACNRGVCTLHSVRNRFGGFEVSFTVGEGNPNATSGTVTNIYTDGASRDVNENRNFWAFTVRYRRGNCTQNINVPRSVYYAVNRYMYGLMEDDGSTRRGFTPADEAMIMFYTTIMDKASGCTMN